jgi:hypothetical protein
MDNIKMNLREIGWDGVDCINMDQDRDQWGFFVQHDIEHPGSIKCWEVLEWLHN